MTQQETTDLEHELATALRKVDEQRELLRLCKEENEEKRKDIVWTMGERAKLIDRIKRLEEAGDKLHWAWSNPFDPAGETMVDNWIKAKEVKL